MRERAGDSFGRLLDERLVDSHPVTDDVRAEIDAARASPWLAPADARYFERRAYSALVDAGTAGA